jgi:membrane-bound lytic murein transglycosylase D
MVNKYVHFDQITTTLSFNKEYLEALNPMYRRGVIPATENKAYPIVLPHEKTFEFIERDTAVFAYEREKYFPNNTLVNPASSSSGYFTPSDVEGKAKIIYTVKSGDTVGGIAATYKVRINDLTYWNNIRRNLIKIGQKLAIYVPEKDKSKYANNTASKKSTSKVASSGIQNTASDAEFELYTVKSGDNVWVIAQKYDGVTTDDILQLNNISNERGLVVGQKLKIRKKT